MRLNEIKQHFCAYVHITAIYYIENENKPKQYCKLILGTTQKDSGLRICTKAAPEQEQKARPGRCKRSTQHIRSKTNI